MHETWRWVQAHNVAALARFVAAGMPLAALPPGQYPLGLGGGGGPLRSTPRFIQVTETVRAPKSGRRQ